MSAESDIFAELSPALAALVGARIYPDVRPQEDELPAIVYYRESTEPINTIHGTNVGERVTMGVQCLAETRLEAEAIATAAQNALSSRALLERTATYIPEIDVFAAIIKVLHNS